MSGRVASQTGLHRLSQPERLGSIEKRGAGRIRQQIGVSAPKKLMAPVWPYGKILQFDCGRIVIGVLV